MGPHVRLSSNLQLTVDDIIENLKLFFRNYHVEKLLLKPIWSLHDLIFCLT